MTKWYNYGICITDESIREELINELENIGMVLIADQENGIKVSENARKVDEDEIERAISQFIHGVSSVIFITANDTSDTARGKVYEVEENSLKQIRSGHSGGEDTRYEWGISNKGMTVDGGKYY